ncbi:DUF4132 domain-containing protein [Actinocorallia sp. A-T 12471]|uniref:DUF4132 domain-containing protein n=1 Tax=Actinocorallia sp. A-T 12471 TaxID=3089813 RepID=UPI0029CE40C1|nr:DUF4132 domain-containing protein [Actinocorallia sp. A-T 12471]MDX6742782.1 DUF4132 domain-containing protein [Actinocorallia sp. A-T 12471]
MSWTPAGEDYEVALVDGRIAARRASGGTPGRPLKTLPKALREHPEVERLRAFADWLERHDAECVAKVDAWMISSLPVPAPLLGRVWADESWRAALRDMAVVGDDPEDVGFLRDVSESGELRVVNLDGDTVRLSAREIRVPHPVLLPDLAELRAFAAELGVTQRVEQIYRATWTRPEDERTGTGLRLFAGARYRSRFRLAARAASLGYRVSGGYAACTIREGGRTLEAALWIGAPGWDVQEVETGALSWRDGGGGAVRFAEVGPVAWSEGMRMASALFAGRVVEEDK